MISQNIRKVMFHDFARLYNSNAPIKRTADMIRKEFLDYFATDLEHTVICSSPVSPLTDRSIAFVNAGMIQFKGVFLDNYDPPARRVVNSQKCIRVGGKHNDLNAVGNDTYHHTFFEMLGNWSFNDYFKEDACRYAWNLLTNIYGIKKDYLYVTYFGGDEKLGLKPDLECRDIWLSLGLAPDKVLPFGMEYNFWEMGLSGPCGPCTEIHVNHTMQNTNQSGRVNKGYADLTELWNIVFIQYERQTCGSIIPLSKHHIDTGMGFERLVALLQGKCSNYDTDLFQPLFGTIHKYSGAPKYNGSFGDNDVNGIDRGYRILADHARMITVALADNILPTENHKLRRIIRKSIEIGERVFKKNGILSELAYAVAENLGETYPELRNNLNQVHTIIRYEEESFKRLRKSSAKQWQKIVKIHPELCLITDWVSSGLIPGYKYLQSELHNIKETGVLPGHVSFKLYDTYGLNSDIITELAEVASLRFDEMAFKKELDNAILRSRIGIGNDHSDSYNRFIETLRSRKVPNTDDSLKYEYTFDGTDYKFPLVESNIVGLITDDIELSQHCDCGDQNEGVMNTRDTSINIWELQNTDKVGIVLDKTACYAEEGGQIGDKGRILIKDIVFNVHTVKKMEGYVIHFGNFDSNQTISTETKLHAGDQCMVTVDSQFRIGAMKHHTATHLLNAALKQVVNVAYQNRAAVYTNGLRFQFCSFGERLTLEHMKVIEDLINSVIKANIPVTTKTLNLLQLLAEKNVTLLSDETYPETGIRVVEVTDSNFKSKEACCGTHIHNTGMLEHFCFLSHSTKGAARCVVTAIVGPLAKLTKKAGEDLKSRICKLKNDFLAGSFDHRTLEAKIAELKHHLSRDTQDAMVPHIVKEECLQQIQDLSRKGWMFHKEKELASITNEVTDAINSTSEHFLVHCMQQNVTSLSLNEVMSIYPNMPMLLILCTERNVKVRCSIPQEMVSDTFNAQSWIREASEIFNVKPRTTRGFNPLLVAYVNAEINPQCPLKELIEKVVHKSRQFALKHTRERNLVNEKEA